MQDKLTVGVVFGGASVEHEVSVISGLQVAAALDRERYYPVPLYIAKDGTWYTGGDEFFDTDFYRDLEDLRQTGTAVRLASAAGSRARLIETEPSWLNGLTGGSELTELEVLFLALHGATGENGSLQGMCELLGVPYTGSGVLGSAIGMDKVLAKQVARAENIPVVDFVSFREGEWAHREDEYLDRCEEVLGYPMIVKPAGLGSSIGIARVDSRSLLDKAIEDGFRYDDKLLIERAVEPLRELNCSVLGEPANAEASVLEEPVRSGEEALLSYKDKYERGDGSGKQEGNGGAKAARREGMASLDRVIPADVSAERTANIQEMAVNIFRSCECAGVARVDFLFDEAADTVYFNEINTIPGSFAFYLWEPSGVSFDVLAHRMIELARKRHRAATGRLRSYDTNLLALQAGGIKSKQRRE
jgi:D-alanine-D-alanine ligase